MPDPVSPSDTSAATLTSLPAERRSAAHLRQILAAALERIPAPSCVTTGPSHVVDLINQRYQDVIGGEQILGRQMRDVPGVDSGLLDLMDVAFASGETQTSREVPLSARDGAAARVRFYNWIYEPLRDDAGGQVCGLMVHGVDVTEQVQARHALEARTHELERVATRLRLATEAGRLGTWEWELPSRRITWSPEIERIHGLELGTFAGTFEAFQFDLHPEDRDRVMAQVEDTITNHTPYLLQYRIVLPTGEIRWIEARGQMFMTDDGKPDRVVGICMDITERKHAEEALAQRAAERARITAALERSNRELDAFAYAASHDLRAPLRGIANLAVWIQEDLSAAGDPRPEVADMLDLMRSRMMRMEALIEGILQYSRAGRVSQKIERVDTKKLVREVVDLLAPPEEAKITIGALPTFEAPALPLQQVFMNLISNALKHSQRADVVIRVDYRQRDHFYEFCVKDNGPGIPAEFHDRVWGIFQTLAPRDKVEGTGIGLSLVKKLVEAHGGRVWLESEPDKGAAFYFTWPKPA